MVLSALLLSEPVQPGEEVKLHVPDEVLPVRLDKSESSIQGLLTKLEYLQGALNDFLVGT